MQHRRQHHAAHGPARSAAGGAAVAASGAALAQQARAKGPLVWLDMDQQALDDAYDQMVYAPNRDQVAQAPHRQQRQGARASSARPSASPTGRAEIEKLDIYRTKQAECAGQHLHPRRRLARQPRRPDYAFLAEPFVQAGAHFVVLDFINVDDAGGSLFPMVEQVRRAVGWVYKNAKSFGGDPDRLYLSSHSSGLASRRLRGDARLAQGQACRPTSSRARCLGSGMYDLKPVRLSKRSKYVKFTDEMEEALERAAPHRQAQHCRSSSPTAPTRRRNSSARAAISPRR